jgi:predicted RNA-binding protein with PUA-like domain
MNYWLVKFAPFRCSWPEILRDGKFEIYSVRNPQAANNLRLMRLSDQVLFYHSQEGNAIMGTMRVIEEAHQDKTTSDPRWVSVSFEPVLSFEEPVTLKQIKVINNFADLPLVKQPRLAVMPVEKGTFDVLVKMGSKGN